MRRRTSIRRRSSHNLNLYQMKFVLKEEWKLVTLVSLFLSGMIIGSMVARNMDASVNNNLITMFTDYATMRSTQSIFDTFSNSLFVNFLYLAIAYASGLCAVGIPVISLIPLGRGIGLGLVAGYLYSTYAMTGAGYAIVILFPSAIVAIAALLFGCNESFMMSYDLFHIVNGNLPNKYEGLFRQYSIRYGILLLISVVASVIDTLMTVLFAGKFDL